MFTIRIEKINTDMGKAYKNIAALGNVGVRRIAEDLRDQMRDAYEDSVGGTAYQSPGAPSLANHIVVSPGYSKSGIYEVGAQRGGMNTGVNFQEYDEIFKFMDEGTGERDWWAFKLPESRKSASPDGYWVTRGQEGKEFISGPSEDFAPMLQDYTAKHVEGLIDIAIMTGGVFK